MKRNMKRNMKVADRLHLLMLKMVQPIFESLLWLLLHQLPNANRRHVYSHTPSQGSINTFTEIFMEKDDLSAP